MKQTTHEHNFPNLIVNTSSTTSEYLVFDYKCNIKKMKGSGIFIFFRRKPKCNDGHKRASNKIITASK